MKHLQTLRHKEKNEGMMIDVSECVSFLPLSGHASVFFRNSVVSVLPTFALRALQVKI